MGRKHCGKWRNCSSRAISPFPTLFLKRLIVQTRKKTGLFGKGLKHYSKILAIFVVFQQNVLEINLANGDNASCMKKNYTAAK